MTYTRLSRCLARAAALLLLLSALAGCRPGGTPSDGTETATGSPVTLPDGEIPTSAEPAETVPDAPEVSPNSPEFSIPGGLLDAPAGLTLSLPSGAPEGSYIVFTTDSREPSAEGTRYSSAIPLLKDGDCTVVRAAVFTSGGDLWGPVTTHAYFRAGVSTLRIVSLVVDPDDLYNSRTGLLTDRSVTGRASEKPCNVQITEPDGVVIVRQDAGLRLAGAGSRSFDPASFRVTARKSESLDPDGVRYLGGGAFRAALFGGNDVAVCDKFLLRNGGNDALSQARSGFVRQTGCRDAVANNVCAALEEKAGWQVFAQREVPVVVYLNGEYYGVLNMKQDFDEDLLRRVYGLDADSVAILKGKKNGKQMWYQVETGTDADLSEWQALCAYAAAHARKSDYAEAYRYVIDRLDEDSAVQYLAVMTYLCNTDWPQNNVMVWRCDAPVDGLPYADGRWRFVIRDMDLCFALHDKASQTSSTTYSMADTDTFERILTFYWDGKGYRYDASTGLYGDDMGMQGLFDFLLCSPVFREKLRAAAERLMSDDFAAMCDNEIDRYVSLVRPEIGTHIKTWQAAGKLSSAYSASVFRSNEKDMHVFVKDRPAHYREILENALAHYE